MAFFALNGVSHSFASSEPKNWRYIGYWRDQPIAAWEVEGLDGYGGSLKSGDTLKGVRLKAKGVPGIVRFYAQGFQPPPAFGLNNPAYKSAYEQNVFNNSYSNLTLGPVDPPIQLGPVTFVDTLKNYLSRSRTLGWFTNRPDTAKPLAGELATDSIMTRLTKRLTRVRNALVANDSATARTELTRFINKVQSLYKETNDGDQAPGEIVLTSEAYALLKFNAQFLLAKIAQ